MYPMSISARAAGAFRAAGATPAFMAPDRKPLAAWLINGKPMPGMQVKDAGIAEQVKVRPMHMLRTPQKEGSI